MKKIIFILSGMLFCEYIFLCVSVLCCLGVSGGFCPAVLPLRLFRAEKRFYCVIGVKLLSSRSKTECSVIWNFHP